MNLSRIATTLSLIGAAFIIYVGISYLVTPASMAPQFGLPEWPHGDAVAFLNIKGIRDITEGLIILALLAARQRFALGLATLVIALTPFADMLTVLRYHGSTSTALSVHGLTAVLVALTGGLLLREQRVLRTGREKATATRLIGAGAAQ
ncbi:DUF4267 domain-containing protein [Nocardia sp. NBC_01009]|uniref:DUF4267 domain-containing protein n=1 Tax=Nocardia sp. NBC_01009 TaxID=2975996 RepID=UPI003867F53E|nr:DUF4267 domain-containing protein [Nocardia sp. NBC_01009]